MHPCLNKPRNIDLNETIQNVFLSKTSLRYAFPPTLIILLLLITFTGCNNDSVVDIEKQKFASTNGGLLFPGKYVTGPQDIRIAASKGALSDPVNIRLEAGKPHDIHRLPSPLTPLTDLISIEAAELVTSPNGERFTASLPIPNGIDPDDLVYAVWIPADSPFVSDSDEKLGYWSILDGVVEDKRFESHFYILPDEPYYFTFAEGEWFDNHEVHKSSTESSLEINETQQALSESVSLRVICEKFDDPNDCTYKQRAILSEYLEETISTLAGRSVGSHEFPDPKLREFRSGNANYTIYLRKMRPSSGKGKCRYWTNNGQTYATTGHYNSWAKKLTVCYWPFNQTAPTIEIGNIVTAGTTYFIEINGVTFDITAGPNDDSSDIAYGLATQIRNHPGIIHNAFRWPQAESFGNKVVFNYKNDRSSTPEVDLSVSDSGGFIGFLGFEYARLHTANHEYFHSLQYAEDSRNKPYLEASAVASERSRYWNWDDGTYLKINGVNAPRISRDTLRAPFLVNASPFDDANHNDPGLQYRAQDFYVYIGQRLGLGIEWIIPKMGSTNLATTLDLFGYSKRLLFWDFVRNQYFEKQYPLDNLRATWENKCQPAAIAFDNQGYPSPKNGFQYQEVEYAGGVTSFSGSIAKHTARAWKIEFPQQYSDQAYVIEVDTDNPHTRSVIYRDDYDNDYDCHDIHWFADELEVANIDFGTGSNKAYVLAAATAHAGSATVTVREAETSISIRRTGGEEIGAGISPVITADYEAESGPVKIHWFFDDELFAASNHSQQNGSPSRRPLGICETGPVNARVEIVDALGATAYDEVELNVHPRTASLNFDLPQANSCGATHYLSVQPDTFDNLIITPTYSGCADEPVTDDWTWDVVTATGFELPPYQGDKYQLTEGHFLNNGTYGSVTVTLSHPEMEGTVTKTIQPCTYSGSDGFVTCPTADFCGQVFTGGRIDQEVLRLRDEIDIIMTFDYRMSEICNGLCPDPIPPPGFYSVDDLHRFVEPQTLEILYQIENSFSANSFDEFRTSISNVRTKAAGIDDPSASEFLTSLFVLIETQFQYYLPASKGGDDLWYEFSFLERWHEKGPDPIQAAQTAFFLAIYTWVDAFERHETISLTDAPLRLNEPRILDRMVGASSQGTLREIIGEYTSPK